MYCKQMKDSVMQSRGMMEKDMESTSGQRPKWGLVTNKDVLMVDLMMLQWQEETVLGEETGEVLSISSALHRIL